MDVYIPNLRGTSTTCEALEVKYRSTFFPPRLVADNNNNNNTDQLSSSAQFSLATSNNIFLLVGLFLSDS